MARWPDGDNNSAEALQTATVAEATMAAAVTLVFDAAATTAAIQSAANSGLVGNDDSAAIAMQ